MNLVLFILSTIGMTHIIVDGSIMQWFRDWMKQASTSLGAPSLGSIVDCYLCCGTWCGFLMGYIWITSNPMQIFACGCASGFLANLAAILMNWVEAASIVNFPGDDNEH